MSDTETVTEATKELQSVVKKECSTCRELKPLSEFPKRKNSKDGHRGTCRACKNKRQVEYVKARKEMLEKNPSKLKEKKCNACEHTKDISEFIKSSASKDGYNTVCKSCRQEYNRNYHQHRAKVEATIEEKKCTKCNVVKKTAEFKIQRKTKDGLSPWCKQCIKKHKHSDDAIKKRRKSQKKWRDDNFEHRAKYEKEYRKKNKDRLKKNAAQYKIQRRAVFHAFKSSFSCKICNERRGHVLEIHHVNPDEKEFSLTGRLFHDDNEKFMKEFKKCIILCSNCHKHVHYWYNRLFGRFSRLET